MSLWAIHQVAIKHRRRTPTLASTFLQDPSFGSSSSQAPSSPTKGVLKKSVYVVNEYTNQVGEMQTDHDDFTQTLPYSPERHATKGDPPMGKEPPEKDACSCQWEWGWDASCPLHGTMARKHAKMATKASVVPGFADNEGGEEAFHWEEVE
ncbi:hypothetical protein TeGR_g9963, partial [Tetraparma gracilis]